MLNASRFLALLPRLLVVRVAHHSVLDWQPPQGCRRRLLLLFPPPPPPTSSSSSSACAPPQVLTSPQLASHTWLIQIPLVLLAHICPDLTLSLGLEPARASPSLSLFSLFLPLPLSLPSSLSLSLPSSLSPSSPSSLLGAPLRSSSPGSRRTLVSPHQTCLCRRASTGALGDPPCQPSPALAASVPSAVISAAASSQPVCRSSQD